MTLNTSTFELAMLPVYDRAYTDAKGGILLNMTRLQYIRRPAKPLRPAGGILELNGRGGNPCRVGAWRATIPPQLCADGMKPEMS